jgi:hypothetical protein
MKRALFYFAAMLATRCVFHASPVFAQAMPVAVADTFSVAADGYLSVAAPGVLSNDSAGDSLVAVVVSAPLHGSLSLRPDGSFDYEPDAGFEGTDRFSYRAHVLPLYAFAVDPDRSSLVFHATLDTGLFGKAADTDSSRAEGVIEAYLTPGNGGISRIQIRAADVLMADSVEVLFVLGIGTLHALAQPDSLRLTLLAAGETVPLEDGVFVQTDNELRLGGSVFLTPTAIFALLLSAGPVEIDAVGQLDISGMLIDGGDTYEIRLPVYMEGTMPLEGSSLDVVLRGTVVASASVSIPEVSAETEVIIHVGATTSRSDSYAEVPGRFVLKQNYPNPFNPRTTIGYEVAAAGPVSLEVFDVLGRAVEVLVEGWRPAGRYAIAFEAGDLPGGLYFYRLRAGGREQTRSMLLLK